MEEQLLLCYDYITKKFDDGYSVDVIFFDYRKAFDVVNHRILFEKLALLGIGDPVLGWLWSFLSARSMRVVVHGESSPEIDVCSGVPQGSVIGPLLFLIYINFVTDGLTAKFCLFADDLKLYLAGSCKSVDMDDFHVVLQADIDLLLARSSSWGLSFSVNKCARLNFCRRFADLPPLQSYFLGDQPIPNVSDFRDLGVRVDASLKFHQHIAEVVIKAGGVCHNFLKGTLCRSPSFMRSVFITHVRPIIEWCSVVWFTGYVGDCKNLEKVQRRWTKRVDGLREVSYDLRLAKLDLFSVRGRLLRNDLKMVWKILHGLYPALGGLFQLNTSGITRGHSLKLYVPDRSGDVRSRFFSVRVLEVWNKLPEHVVSSSSIDVFKRGLDQYLGPLLFEYE